MRADYLAKAIGKLRTLPVVGAPAGAAGGGGGGDVGVHRTARVRTCIWADVVKVRLWGFNCGLGLGLGVGRCKGGSRGAVLASRSRPAPTLTCTAAIHSVTLPTDHTQAAWSAKLDAIVREAAPFVMATPWHPSVDQEMTALQAEVGLIEVEACLAALRCVCWLVGWLVGV